MKPARRTVEQACANWLAGRHGLRKLAKAAYRNGLQPPRDRQGKVNYNVAALVDRLPVSKVPIQTFTTVEVERLLDTFAEDRLGHMWHLALAGLRRSEPCRLRWTDIDFDARHSRSASRSPA